MRKLKLYSSVSEPQSNPFRGNGIELTRVGTLVRGAKGSAEGKNLISRELSS